MIGRHNFRQIVIFNVLGGVISAQSAKFAYYTEKFLLNNLIICGKIIWQVSTVSMKNWFLLYFDNQNTIPRKNLYGINPLNHFVGSL
jgi:hypothetical protein